MSRLGVLVNPVAGAGRGARVGAETVDLLRRRGHEVRPVEAGTRRLRAALAADEVDLAVTAAYPPQDPPAAAEVLLTEPLLVALGAGHPLAGRPSLALADLAGEAWAEHFPHSGETLVAAARAVGFEPDVAFEVREWTGKL